MGTVDTIKGWRKIRTLILKRDALRCRICGKDGVEASLNIHHVDYDRKNNKHKNLVTLCGVCHRAVHLERYKPEEYMDYPTPWGQL